MLCDKACYPAGSIHLKKCRLSMNGCTWSVTMSKYVMMSKWFSDGIKASNVCQENIFPKLHVNKQPLLCAGCKTGP